jgi:nucleoside-diphosphate-sugar epimerase
MMSRHKIFIAGGSGYLGSRLIPKLLERGHEVTALVRKGSDEKNP